MRGLRGYANYFSNLEFCFVEDLPYRAPFYPNRASSNRSTPSLTLPSQGLATATRGTYPAVPSSTEDDFIFLASQVEPVGKLTPSSIKSPNPNVEPVGQLTPSSNQAPKSETPLYPRYETVHFYCIFSRGSQFLDFWIFNV
jgi:hypothetical protein